MKTFKLLFTTVLISLASQSLLAQENASRILPNIRFQTFPTQQINYLLAKAKLGESDCKKQAVPFISKDLYSDYGNFNNSYYMSDCNDLQFYFNLNEILDSGLKLNLELVVQIERDSYRRSNDRYRGYFEFDNCYRGKEKLLIQSNSLMSLLQKAKSPLENNYDYCIWKSASMKGSVETPGAKTPFNYLRNVQLEVWPDYIIVKGKYNDEKEFSMYMYYQNKSHRPSSETYSEVKTKLSFDDIQQNLLTILDGALLTLEQEQGDKKLPRTVAYFIENREAYEQNLKLIPQVGFTQPQLLNFLVTIQNAFFILDQAVGLASDRQVDLSAFTGMKKAR